MANYVYFGRTGIQVSDLCLGTMTFGNEADQQESFAMMDRAYEAGLNFFDTADIYAKGASEELVGEWLADRGADIVLASKVHFPVGDAPNDRGNSRLHILRGVEQSLKRLQRDYLDILYLHHWDDHTDLDQSLAAMTHLVDQGKVLYCAVSNFSAWQTLDAVTTAERQGYAPIVAIQPQYNLVKRQAEVEILPLARHRGLAVCPYSPVAAGLLSGKYQREESGRIRNNPNYAERFKYTDYWETSDRFVAHAAEAGHHPAALAIAWVRSHPEVTSPIVGARSLEQLDTALSSSGIELDPSSRDAISALSPEPPTATDRERTVFVPHPE